MNLFTENSDLKFIFKTADLGSIIRMYEDNFTQSADYDYAPGNEADALDNYINVLEVAGDISGRIIAPLSEQIDTEPNVLDQGRVIYSQPVHTCLKALGQADLMACSISRQYGGLNLPNFVFTMLVELVSQADASIQNIFGLQGIASVIEAFADKQLKEKYLPLFSNGSTTGAMALTEDEAGSDLQNVKLKAEEAPDGTWRLNGVKRFITNGGAQILLVLARSEPGTTDGLGLSLFVCEGGSTISVRRLEDKLGIHGSPTCELSFCNTPAHLIGERQRGLVTYVLALLNGARLATAAQSIGIAQAAFNEARAYALTRKQFGRSIETFPAVAEMLTGMKVSIEAARALTYNTAMVMDISDGMVKQLHSNGITRQERNQLKKNSKQLERRAMLLSSLSKYYCSEMSIKVTRDAMQVLGGSGYMRDYPVEKYYRDARITNIYEGTSQMQVLTAFRGILSGTMEKYFEELSSSGFSKPQAPLEKKLQLARKTFSSAVNFLNNSKDSQLMDLYSRQAVDMASDILIGYLFLNQSLFSRRKLKVAKMFINNLGPVFKMKAFQIRNADKSCLKNYTIIVDSLEQ